MIRVKTCVSGTRVFKMNRSFVNVATNIIAMSGNAINDKVSIPIQL